MIRKITKNGGSRTGMKDISQFIVKVNLHKTSVNVVIENRLIARSKNHSTQRGLIREYSWRSSRRLRLSLEDTIHRLNYFIVLTYPSEFPLDGKIVKNHIDRMIKWLKRQGVVDYHWNIEFQARGAIHVNILTDIDIDKRLLSRAWYRIVNSRDPKHLAAGTGIEAIRSKDDAIGYMVGYAGKRDQKDVPDNIKNIGRFWGGNRKIKAQSEYVRKFKKWSDLEKFIKPLESLYTAKMKEWSKDKEKPYSWQFRGYGFMMWQCRDDVEKILSGGGLDE